MHNSRFGNQSTKNRFIRIQPGVYEGEFDASCNDPMFMPSNPFRVRDVQVTGTDGLVEIAYVMVGNCILAAFAARLPVADPAVAIRVILETSPYPRSKYKVRITGDEL